MGYVLAAAAVLAAGGAAYSANGASKNADAIADAQKKIRRQENNLYKKWDTNLNTLIDEKTDKLLNLGDIFERFNSTGAFGDTDTLENLRQAQSDFSRLAAGDFSGFDDQIRKTLSDYSIATIGSGAPIGTYASLSADAMLNYRLQGLQTATDLSNFFDSQAKGLLGLEFGIMDQGFQVGYELDRSRQNAINSTYLGQAQTVGVSEQAWGGAMQTTGAAIASAYTGYVGMQNQQQTTANQTAYLNNLMGQQGQNRATAQTLSMPSYNLTQPSLPSYTSASYPDGVYTSSVPVPVNEAVYNTTPYLPGDESLGVLPPLQQPSQRSTSQAFSSAASTYANNMASPFNALISLGAQIASGYKQQ